MNIKRRVFVCNVIILFLLSFYLLKEQDTLSTNLEIQITYGEEFEAGGESIAQIFFKCPEEDYSEEKSVTGAIRKQTATISFSDYDMNNTEMRLDPLRTETKFTITDVEILYKDQYRKVLSGDEFHQYIIQMVNCEYDEKTGAYVSTNADPIWVLDTRFVTDINQMGKTPGSVKVFGEEGSWWFLHICVFLICVFFAVTQSIVINEYTGKMSVRRILWLIFISLFLSLSGMAAYGERYLEKEFGEVPFGQMLYHLHTPLDGAGVTTFTDLIVTFATIAVVCTFTVLICEVILRKIGRNKGYVGGLIVLGLVFLVPALIRFVKHFDFINYFKYTNTKTELYEEYYVDGREVQLVFPEKKRNLIYIYLESMEVTFADEGSGGAMQENYMPELTRLAQENICFSGGNELNGAYVVPGATFTMGALVSHTAGVPINEKLVSNDTLNGYWESENNYLPGVWAIGDVLAEEGYNQTFLIGSDGKFAGRSSYFHGHGNYVVDDYYMAIEEGWIDEDYFVWWGYEDEILFEHAKDELLKLADQDEPFNFTMLTVDTHFSDGYFCDLCQDEYGLQYSNVISCSSKQTYEFVKWIQQQEFYDNTTIVLVGDHLTADSAYVEATGVGGFDRRTYYTMINPADGCEDSTTRRYFTTMDMYPTTLAGMGVDIEGNRLGLGVNLFSGEATLYEEYGEELRTELLKNSDYYTEQLLYGQ